MVLLRLAAPFLYLVRRQKDGHMAASGALECCRATDSHQQSGYALNEWLLNSC